MAFFLIETGELFFFFQKIGFDPTLPVYNKAGICTNLTQKILPYQPSEAQSPYEMIISRLATQFHNKQWKTTFSKVLQGHANN